MKKKKPVFEELSNQKAVDSHLESSHSRGGFIGLNVLEMNFGYFESCSLLPSGYNTNFTLELDKSKGSCLVAVNLRRPPVGCLRVPIDMIDA